jgi:L-ribulose-5-phosphate 4-epimerase
MIKLITEFKKACLKSNKDILVKNLAIQTFGNASQRVDQNIFVIKPSGVNLKRINDKDLVIIDINSGKKIKSKLEPSTDTETHRVLYKQFPNLRGIAHAHSTFLTSWAQTGKSIPNLGTTHSDYWRNEIPITDDLKPKDIKKNYEYNTGKSIISILMKKKLNPEYCPGVLTKFHGAFAWGNSSDEAVKNLEAMEFIAELAFYTTIIGYKKKVSKKLVDKHFFRKHGKNKYYGQ